MMNFTKASESGSMRVFALDRESLLGPLSSWTENPISVSSCSTALPPERWFSAHVIAQCI